MKLREALDTYMFDNVGQFGGIAESLSDRIPGRIFPVPQRRGRAEHERKRYQGKSQGKGQ